MRRPFFAVLAALALVTSAAATAPPPPVNQRAIAAERPPQRLSDYRFFLDDGAHQPNLGVTPYALNTPLWSDGALKFRYVYVPPGAQAQYRDDGVFEFPVGTVLIKTFAFAADMRAPDENVRLLETRLLIHREEGWIALPYVWNEAQTEARLSPVGADLPVSFTDDQGRAIALEWHVPNRNECSGCHNRAGAITPIGPSARNLNREMDYPGRVIGGSEGAPVGGRDNNPIILEGETAPQLHTWRQLRLLDGLPESESPRAPDAYDPASGTLNDRARAYLDVNCAHCHNPQGPGHTSGLDLSWSQRTPIQWGVFKRPVAAGRGSAGFNFAIEPGHPERSFLLHRMASTDPGVMMPETGRTLADERAVALIRQWIAEMGDDGRPRQPQ